MENLFITKSFSEDEKLLYVTFDPEFKTATHQASFFDFFQTELNDGIINWVLDLKDMPFPTTSIMALFIAATVLAREKGGELKLVSLPQSAKNNFSTFSPLTFLSMEASLKIVLNEVNLSKKEEKNTDVADTDPEEKTETPIVDTFDHSPFLDEETSTIVLDDDLFHEQPPESTIRFQQTKKKEKRFIEDQIQVDSSSLELYRICDFIVHHARVAGIKEKQIGKIKISVYEACLNVIEHAYHSQSGNTIEVGVEYNPEYFKIVIRDFGLAFRNKRQDEYDVEKAVENRQSGGFGLHIINRSMDDVSYNSDELNGNQLVMIKYLPA